MSAPRPVPHACRMTGTGTVDAPRLPLPAPDPAFIVATGIECSAPVIAGGLRRDELRLTGHWERYREDLALVRELGIRYLRYGIPFHVVAREPGVLDWSWTDDAMEAIAEAGIEPIADLLHFGVPEDLTGITDPRLQSRFLTYVEAFVDRYPWVRWYTPVNEPFITAQFSTLQGWWNERLTDEGAFALAIDRLVGLDLRAVEIIRAARPDAVILQSDACESYRPASLRA